MRSSIIIVGVVLCTFGEKATSSAKGTGGPRKATSSAGSRAGDRHPAKGDSSRSGQARRINQQVPRKTDQSKGNNRKDDPVVLDHSRGARIARAAASSFEDDVGSSDEQMRETDHVERLSASGAVDREYNDDEGRYSDDGEEEGEYYLGDEWESEGEGEGKYSGGGFDLLEEDDVLSDIDDGDDDGDRDNGRCRYGSGNDRSRRGDRNLQRRDRHQGAAQDGGAHLARRRADDRRQSSSRRGILPVDRERNGGSVMKSVGSATGRSVRAVVHALQPKSVGLGEILDTWKIEQVIGKPPGRVTRCAATVEFRRDGTVATSFEGRETVSDFTFRSYSWPRACTIEFRARAFQGPWDEEPVWKIYKGFFSRKLMDSKVITMDGAIYDETGKMLWKRRVKVGKFNGRRRPSRASRARVANPEVRAGADPRREKRGSDDVRNQGARGRGDIARPSSRETGARRRSSGNGRADEL